MNRQAEYGYEKTRQRDDSLADQVTDTAREYASKAREVGEGAIDRADEYLRPIGLSLKEKPMTTLAVFGGIAFAAGALWMLRNSRQQSRYDEVMIAFVVVGITSRHRGQPPTVGIQLYADGPPQVSTRDRKTVELPMSFDLEELNRRGVIALAAALATGTVAGGLLVPARASDKTGADKGQAGDDDLSATEDLMREHGVLRRALIVYAELASRLQAGRRDLNLTALGEAAKLFREFGENYHERVLEEQYVFPEVRKTGGPNEKLVEVLLAQHERAREITAYLEHISARGKIGADAQPLSRALAGMSRMYNAHATWEDTVVFPAWTKTQSKRRMDELAKKFEEMERQQFGKDGFEDGIERMTRVEQMLGLSELSHYTAAAPPKI